MGMSCSMYAPNMKKTALAIVGYIFLYLGLVLPGGASVVKKTEPKTPDKVLARVTFYAPDAKWGTLSSTGERLKHLKHCAVDPSVIAYGSIVHIDGIGKLRAVDTGSAVKSRKAARKLGRNKAERNAIVIDVFVKSEKELDRLNKLTPDFLWVEIE